MNINWNFILHGLNKCHICKTSIAIMPITEKRGDIFSGSEYLQIYPIIKTEYYYSLGSYYVEYNGKKIKLENWLKS